MTWADDENAQRYDAFARQFPMYDRTSRDLIERAAPAPEATLVDLCCGTGRTTLAALAVLGDRGRVIGVDGSAAMLALARRSVTDPRVSWVEGPAEQFGALVGGPVDAVVCNSAIWQTDIPATARAARQVLRPGGRFAFNIGRRLLEPAGTEAPGLALAMREMAARDHGWAPPEAERARSRMSTEGILAVLTEAGFDVDPVRQLEFTQAAGEQHAWLSIPIFTERLLPGLDYDKRMAVLAKVHAVADAESQWMVFTATRRADR